MSPDPATSGPTTRSCLACGVEFTVDSATIRRVYCSRECRRHATLEQQPVERTCLRCGGTFESLPIRPRRYCSTACRTGARTDPTTAEERACVICGNAYQVHGTSRQVYCSPDCRRAAEVARERARHEARARRLGTVTARAFRRAAVALAPTRQPNLPHAHPPGRPPANVTRSNRPPQHPRPHPRRRRDPQGPLTFTEPRSRGGPVLRTGPPARRWHRHVMMGGRVPMESAGQEAVDVTMVEALRLDDGAQSVVVNIATKPSFRSGDHRYHAAELVVRSGWINTRTDLDVRVGGPDDELTEWAEALRRLGEWEAADGELDTAVEWPSAGEGGCLRIVVGDPYQVSVSDGPRTGITVQIPLDLPTDWAETNTATLDSARQQLTA